MCGNVDFSVQRKHICTTRNMGLNVYGVRMTTCNGLYVQFITLTCSRHGLTSVVEIHVRVLVIARDVSLQHCGFLRAEQLFLFVVVTFL